MTFTEFYLLIRNHIEHNWKIYAGILAVMIPVIIVTRKWSLPFIFYTIETLIYLVIMHVVTHMFVILVVWFKVNTSMRALREDGTPAEVPDWATPLYDFWNLEGYIPQWIAYVEMAFAIAIILLVIWFRPPVLGPVKTKRAKKRQQMQNAIREELEKRKARYMEDILP